MIKLINCLHRKPELSLEEFHDHWLRHHAPIVMGNRLEGRAIRRYVQYHRLINDPVYESMAQAEGATSEPYDGIAVLWWDSAEAMADDLQNAPETPLAEADAEHFIDLERSSMLLVEERVVIEPAWEYDIVLFECLCKRDDIDHATFSQLWDDHAFIGRQANKRGLLMGYLQNVALAPQDPRWQHLPERGPDRWDGVVTAYFESVAKLKTLLHSPLAAEEAFEDEKRFMDHSRSSYMVAQRHVIKDVVR